MTPALPPVLLLFVFSPRKRKANSFDPEKRTEIKAPKPLKPVAQPSEAKKKTKKRHLKKSAPLMQEPRAAHCERKYPEERAAHE